MNCWKWSLRRLALNAIAGLQTLGRQAMEYRVYLADSGDRFRAAEFFNAQDDVEAKEIALALYGSCATNFHGVELWRGTSRLIRQARNGVWPTVDLQALINKRQESVAQLEEMLARSNQCVRESQQLMAALEQLRAG
jgi:hypothetical protein